MVDHDTINSITLIVSGVNLGGVVVGLFKIWTWTTSVETRFARLEEKMKLYDGFRDYVMGKPTKHDTEGS